MEDILWNDSRTVGYFPVDKWLKENKKTSPYDHDYLKKYEGYATSEMGKKITQARVDLIMKYIPKEILDIGIGSGSFMDACLDLGLETYGYDVNPVAIERLGDLFRDPELQFYDSLSFWDSLEHMKNPRSAVFSANRYVFMTIPIFRDIFHAQNSKHFRPDEHYWYFTHFGLLNFMAMNDFKLIEHSNMEEDFGREDVKTYVFKRRT